MRCCCKKYTSERAENLGHRCDELGAIPKGLGRPAYNPGEIYHALEKTPKNIGIVEALKALLDISPFATDPSSAAIHRQAEAAIREAEGL